MRWRDWRLAALYVASCFALIHFTIGSERALGLLRQSTTRVAAAVPDVVEPAQPDLARDGDSVPGPQARKSGSRTREYQVPIGSVLSVRLRTAVSSASGIVNDQIDATLTDAVTQDGVELIPAGSILHGTLVDVLPASKKMLRGQVTMVFAVVQHAATRSRAGIRTRSLTIEAREPEPSPNAPRHPKRQPVDVDLPDGHPLELTLAEPLIVFIPVANPSQR